jgi:hypothetical protein
LNRHRVDAHRDILEKVRAVGVGDRAGWHRALNEHRRARDPGAVNWKAVARSLGGDATGEETHPRDGERAELKSMRAL